MQCDRYLILPYLEFFFSFVPTKYHPYILYVEYYIINRVERMVEQRITALAIS